MLLSRIKLFAKRRAITPIRTNILRAMEKRRQSGARAKTDAKRKHRPTSQMEMAWKIFLPSRPSVPFRHPDRFRHLDRSSRDRLLHKSQKNHVRQQVFKHTLRSSFLIRRILNQWWSSPRARTTTFESKPQSIDLAAEVLAKSLVSCAKHAAGTTSDLVLFKCPPNSRRRVRDRRPKGPKSPTANHRHAPQNRVSRSLFLVAEETPTSQGHTFRLAWHFLYKF